jgi:hypothetical protein
MDGAAAQRRHETNRCCGAVVQAVMSGGDAEDMAEYLQRMNKQLDEMTAQHLQVCCRCTSSSSCCFLPETVLKSGLFPA